MIGINTNSKQLDLLLPQNSRVINEALKHASPKQLQDLVELSDPKAMLKSLFQERVGKSSSNEVLLTLLKHTPQFKQLGNFGDGLKTLLNDLKREPELAQKSDALARFGKHIEQLRPQNLKSQLSNSGVFLESKISHAIQKLPQTINQLKDLHTLAKTVLNDEKTLQNLAQKALDPKDVQAKLETKADPKTDIKADLKSDVKADTKTELKADIRAESKPELKAENKVEPKTDAKVETKADPLRDTKTEIKSGEIRSTLMELEAKTKQILDSSHLKQASTKLDSAIKVLEGLKDLSTTLKALPLESKAVAEFLPKLHAEVEKALIAPELKASREALQNIKTMLQDEASSPSQDLAKKVDEALKLNDADLRSKLNELLSHARSHSTPSSKLLELHLQLTQLNRAEELHLQSELKSSTTEDLKSTLMQIKDELKLAQNPALAESADKLLMQIEYHQLLSSLTNASSIYIPFAWDELQDGKILIKSKDKNKFYCEINLDLKNYGELDILLGLYDQNQLDMQLYTPSEELHTLIFKHIATLRSALIDASITPRTLRVHHKNSSIKQIENNYSPLHHPKAFEVKV